MAQSRNFSNACQLALYLRSGPSAYCLILLILSEDSVTVKAGKLDFLEFELTKFSIRL